jgi:hypothetical protein
MRKRRIGAFAFVLVVGMLALGLGRGAQAAAMSTDSTEQTMAAYTQALDSGAPSAGYLADDVVLTFGDSGRQVRGQASVDAAIQELYHGAFAGRMTVTESIVGRGTAAASGELVGTQIGPFAGLAATGNSMAVPYTASYQLVDGRITALQLDFSTAEILYQLATAPTAGTASIVRNGSPS